MDPQRGQMEIITEERGRMEGEKVCVEQSALKAKFIKVYVDQDSEERRKT